MDGHFLTHWEEAHGTAMKDGISHWQQLVLLDGAHADGTFPEAYVYTLLGIFGTHLGY